VGALRRTLPEVKEDNARREAIAVAIDQERGKWQIKKEGKEHRVSRGLGHMWGIISLTTTNTEIIHNLEKEYKKGKKKHSGQSVIAIHRSEDWS